MQTLAILLLAAAAVLAYEHEEHHAPIPYKFEYGVKDPHTGDHKSAWEHGDGHGGVKGSYTFQEADGTHRVVEYHDDGKSGLHATVKRVGHADHPQKYGHESHGYDHGHGGHGHASSYANQNQYEHHAHYY